MLILGRKAGESLTIGGDISITVLSVDSGGNVSLGIQAPKEMLILRSELQQAVSSNQEAAQSPSTPQLLASLESAFRRAEAVTPPSGPAALRLHSYSRAIRLPFQKRQWSPRSWQYRSCCKCSPPPPALAISLMSTPEQKQAWILCAEYPCLLFTINASDPRCCPEPVCTAGMTHIRAPFYVIWFRVLRLIPFV